MTGFFERFQFYWYTSTWSKKLGVFSIILILLTIPLAVYVSGQNQENRSRASGEQIEFTLTPTSATKVVGDVINTEIAINTGSFDVSAVDITVTFPPTYLSVTGFTKHASNSYSHISRTNDLNPTAGTLKIALVNPGSTVHRGTVILGTVSFKADTVGDASVGITQARVTAAGQQNSLTTNLTQVATYVIGRDTIANTPTPTSILEATATPIVGATATPTQQPASPTPTRAPTPTPLGPQTPILFSFKLSETTTPLQRPYAIQIFGASGSEILSKTVETENSEFNSANNTYTSRQSVDTSLISSGNFTIKVKPVGFLAKTIPGIHTLASVTTTSTLPSVTFVAGDLNNDNRIDIFDYNALIACFDTKANSPECATTKSIADYNNDGRINNTDYSLFIRSISTSQGD